MVTSDLVFFALMLFFLLPVEVYVCVKLGTLAYYKAKHLAIKRQRPIKPHECFGEDED